VPIGGTPLVVSGLRDRVLREVEAVGCWAVLDRAREASHRLGVNEYDWARAHLP
jgi:hypothetical protein